MKEIDFYTYRIHVTSEIVFGDGHKEDGESADLTGEIRSRSAGAELERIRESLVDSIYHKPPFAGFLKGFRQMLNDPNDPTYKSRQKIEIIFYVNESATGYNQDTGKTVDFENDFNYIKPYF
jgi:hypothetical protein